jgi:hypothetical protein
MAKYSDIKGFTVQTLSTDTVASQIAGGSWSAGGNLPGGRDETTGGGTLTAGILFGGYDHPAYKPETFEYNGTAWTEGGDMSNARSNFGGLGTQTAALAVGGQNPGLSPYPFNGSEEYNGSSWTTGGTLPGGFDGNYGCTGTQTAGLQIGGTLNPNTKQVKTLSYNGTSWSDTGHDVPTALDRNGATGTSTAAMTGGGRAPSATNAFNIYNGSSWTSITNYPASGYHFQLQGPYTDVIASGGYPLNANANWWDGTSWTTAPSLSNNHGQAAKANSTAGATSGDGFVAGADPSSLNGTEHWNSAPPVFNQITEGQLFFNSTTNTFKETISDIPPTTWASGGALNQARSFADSAGTGTSSVLFGGSPGPTQAYTEQYDGSSWTEVSDLNTGRAAGASGGASGTDAVMGGGYKLPNVGNSLDTEIWNGSSWTEVNNLNSQKYVAGRGITISTSGIGFGGSNGSITANAEVWDGTNWTEVNNLNTARYYLGGFGSATSAIASNGINPGASPSYTQNRIEKWDGTSWTEIAELNTARAEIHGGSGVDNTLGFITGGSTTGSNQIANVELWNGSSWSEVNDLSTATRMAAVNGPSTSALHSGGTTSGNPVVTTTEEWTAPLANKTITAS